MIPVWFVTARTGILKTLETGKEITPWCITPWCSWRAAWGLYFLQYWGSPPFSLLYLSWCGMFILHGADQCIFVWGSPWAESFLAVGTLQEHHSFSLILSRRKVRRKFIFAFTPSSSHQLSSHRKTSSETLSCACIVKLCSAAMALPLSCVLPVRKDHNPLNSKQ